MRRWGSSCACSRATEPITYESEWFTLRDALLHLRPYTQPHFPIAVAAAQSPSGMVLAGKHGCAVLSVTIIRGGAFTTKLSEFWDVAEEMAAEHGKTMNRDEWRLVLHVHLAESRREALAAGASRRRALPARILRADSRPRPR